MNWARGVFWGAVLAGVLACAGIAFVAWQLSGRPPGQPNAVYLLASHTTLTWVCALLASHMVCGATVVLSGTQLARRSGLSGNWILSALSAGFLVVVAAAFALVTAFSAERTFVVAHCGEGAGSSWVAVEELPVGAWQEAPSWWVYDGGPSWFALTRDHFDGPDGGVNHLARGDYEVRCASNGTGILTFGEFTVPIPYTSHQE